MFIIPGSKHRELPLARDLFAAARKSLPGGFLVTFRLILLDIFNDNIWSDHKQLYSKNEFYLNILPNDVKSNIFTLPNGTAMERNHLS